MNQSRADQQTKKLKEERTQTLVELGHVRERLEAELKPDIEEGDPQLVERENASALMRVLEHRLTSINDALQQAQQGRYGVCEGCGQPIDPARLEAVPETTLCLKCKIMTERGVDVSMIAAQKAHPVQA
jgi:RNA polymerase-binding transcription factor DksA